MRIIIIFVVVWKYLLSVTLVHVREQTYSCVSPPVRVICLTCTWTGLSSVSLERRPVILRDELQLDYEHSIISPRGWIKLNMNPLVC